MDGLPPLNALKAFEAAGRLQSISDAAAELCVTSAAVSRQIRLLEDFLGLRLFHRQHRRIVLTDAGREFHAEIARSFAGIVRATGNLAARSHRKVFHIKAPHSVAMRWLLPRLSGFHHKFPDIDVKLNTSVVPPDFDSEDIDAAIVMGKGQWRHLLSYKIMPNELVPVCTPEKSRRLRRPADLAGEILLHTMARPDYWQLWLTAAGVPAMDAGRGMHYESSALTYEAALEGYGVAISQKAMVQRELDEGRLVMPFALSVDLGDESYYFVVPRDPPKRLSRELTQFRGWVASCGLPAPRETGPTTERLADEP